MRSIYLWIAVLALACSAAGAQPASSDPKMPAEAGTKEPEIQRPEQSPTLAPDETPMGTPAAVIPQGREELLAEMLARGVVLPGDCKLTAGKIQYSVVIATYGCTAGEVVLALVHQATAPASAPRTEHFALTIQKGSPPPGLVDAVMSSIRQHEKDFEWQWTAQPEGGLVNGITTGLVKWITIGLAVCLLAAAALWMRRRRS